MGVAINYLQFLMLVFLKLLNEVFVTDYSTHKQREQIQAEFDKAKEYADILMVVMETHTNNEKSVLYPATTTWKMNSISYIIDDFEDVLERHILDGGKLLSHVQYSIDELAARPYIE